MISKDRVIIPDASVVIKLVIPEEDSRKARDLAGSRLEAPELLWIECANVLLTKVRRGVLSDDEASQAYSALLALPIQRVQLTDSQDLAFRLGIELKHPIYDCVYLATAVMRDGIMLTADNKFFAKAHANRLVRDHIRLL